MTVFRVKKVRLEETAVYVTRPWVIEISFHAVPRRVQWPRALLVGTSVLDRTRGSSLEDRVRKGTRSFEGRDNPTKYLLLARLSLAVYPRQPIFVNATEPSRPGVILCL